RVPESLQHSDGAGVHLPQRRHLAGQVRLVHAGGGNPGVHQPVTNRRRPEMRCDMKDMNDMRIGNRIEELSLNHWPALVTMARGGWLLRFADGYTKRANSVSAIYGEEGGEEELEERIAWCERRFAELGVPAVFKMTPFDRPAGLDGLLDKRGYEKKDTTSVRTVELAGLPEPARRDVRSSERLAEERPDHVGRVRG